jgi:hypothetical protein
MMETFKYQYQILWSHSTVFLSQNYNKHTWLRKTAVLGQQLSNHVLWQAAHMQQRTVGTRVFYVAL